MTNARMAERPVASEPHSIVRSRSQPPDYRAVLRNVSKTYNSVRGPIEVLDRVSVNIAEGEFLSILGPSGCGKSTLLKCVAGLETITSGELLVAGKPVRSPPNDLGMVFQRDLLLDWRNILDNVLITAQFIGRPRRDFLTRAQKLLAAFGLSEYERRYPWELSGGMRQRAAICRALLDSPKFLLMDEPFGALDALTRDELNVEMQANWLRDKTTVLFITHSISEAVFLSDRVAVMARNPGRIAEIVEIDLPRPRPLAIRDTPDFIHYTAHLRQTMTRTGAIKAD